MKIADLGRLLRIPGAAAVFLRPYFDRLWPFLYPAASLYRATAIRRTGVVAVVGSLGKTTTARALRTVLVPRQPAVSYSNYGSSLAANLLRCPPGARWWVLETGIARPGWMARYGRMLRPRVAVVTSIKSDHHRSLPTLEATREEKVHMVRALDSQGLAVLNGDDPNVLWMASQTRGRVVTFGLGPSNQVRATDVVLDWPHGTRFTITVGGEQRSLRSPLIGEHLVYPVLAAIAVGLEAGLGWDDLARRVEQLSPAPGRMEVTPLPNGAIILDDSYKGTLESFHTSLEVLSRIPAGRRIAVLADVEEVLGQSGDVYRTLGATVARASDSVIFIGSKVFGQLKTGATRAGMNSASLTYVGSSIQAAASRLEGELTPDTIVLLKGAHRWRLSRVKLLLLSRIVRCRARTCTARTPSCEACPLLEQEEPVFANRFIRQYVQ